MKPKEFFSRFTICSMSDAIYALATVFAVGAWFALATGQNEAALALLIAPAGIGAGYSYHRWTHPNWEKHAFAEFARKVKQIAEKAELEVLEKRIAELKGGSHERHERDVTED